MKTKIKGFIVWVMGGLLMLACLGCQITHTGGMESGVGYSSTTKVFMYHEVDGDKVDNEAKSEIESELVEKLLLPDSTDENDPE